MVAFLRRILLFASYSRPYVEYFGTASVEGDSLLHFVASRASEELSRCHICHQLNLQVLFQWADCMRIGRDLVRLLIAVARIPEFDRLWQDIINNPTSLCPQFSGKTVSTGHQRRYV